MAFLGNRRGAGRTASRWSICGFEPLVDLTAKLGKFKTGKACLYVKKLEDIDVGVLEQKLARSTKQMKGR